MGAAIRDYIWFGLMPVATIGTQGNGTATSELSYLHADHLSRPAFATDSSGTVIWDGGITTPFGMQVETMGALTQSLMFPGQYQDEETGCFDNWHRTYDPTLGRYLQSDPIGLAGGLNRYAYVGGNPVSLVDPDGLNPFSAAALIARELAKRFAVGALSGGGIELISQIVQSDWSIKCLNFNRIGTAAFASGIGGLVKTKSPLEVISSNHFFRKRLKKLGFKAFNKPGLMKDIQGRLDEFIKGFLIGKGVNYMLNEPFDPCECKQNTVSTAQSLGLRGRYAF